MLKSAFIFWTRQILLLVSEVEPKDLHMAGKHATTELYSSTPLKDIFAGHHLKQGNIANSVQTEVAHVFIICNFS